MMGLAEGPTKRPHPAAPIIFLRLAFRSVLGRDGIRNPAEVKDEARDETHDQTPAHDLKCNAGIAAARLRLCHTPHVADWLFLCGITLL